MAALDAPERACLTVLRQFCLAWSNPASQAWERAFDAADAAYGARLGPTAARLTLELLRAFRTSRKSTFRFNNPLCAACAAGVTDAERLVAGVLSAARAGDATAAQARGIVLCEGGPTEATLAAAAALAAFAATLPGDLPRVLPPDASQPPGHACGKT